MKYQPIDFCLRDSGEKFFLRTIESFHVPFFYSESIKNDSLLARLLTLDDCTKSPILNYSIDELEKKIQEIADLTEELLLGLFYNETLIGGAFIKQEGRLYLEIQTNFRSRGLGTAVLEQLMYFSSKNSIPYLSGIVNKENKHAYSLLTKMGFFEEAWIDKNTLQMEASMKPSGLWTSNLSFLNYPSEIRYKAQIASENEALMNSFKYILIALPFIGQEIQDENQKMYWINGVHRRLIFIKDISQHIFRQTQKKEELKGYNEKLFWSNDLTVYISSFIINVSALFDSFANIICFKTGFKKKQRIGFGSQIVRCEIESKIESYIKEYNRIKKMLEFTKFSQLRNDESHNIPGYIPLLIPEQNLKKNDELDKAICEAKAKGDIEEYHSLLEQQRNLLEVDAFFRTQHIDDERKNQESSVHYEEFLLNISYLLCGAVCSFASIVLQSKLVDGLIDQIKENRTESLIVLDSQLKKYDNLDNTRNVSIKYLYCDKRW